MGVIWDIVKDIPQAAVLKERVVDFERKLAEAETQVDLLNIDLRKAEAKIDQLTAENKRLSEQINASVTSDNNLDPTAHNILAEFARQGGGNSVPKTYILQAVTGDATAVSYYFDELVANQYLTSASFNIRTGPNYRLTQKGKKYWMDNQH